MARPPTFLETAGAGLFAALLAAGPAHAQSGQLTLVDPAKPRACDGPAAGGVHVGLADGRELVIGGTDCDGDPSASAALLDRATGQSTPTGPMSIGRRNFAAVALADGDAVVFGGETGGGMAAATDRIEEYDAAAGRWSTIGYLSQRKGGMGACVLDDGGVLLVGGRGGPDDHDAARTRSAELFDPATKSVRLLPAKTNLEHRDHVEATRLSGGRCLVTSRGDGLNMEIFDPKSGTFGVTAPPPAPAGAPLDPSLVSELPDGTLLMVGHPSLVFDAATGAYRIVPGTDQ